jgi:serine/threonine-protein kinase
MSDLRELMADPHRGAWLMADIVVPRVGEATFSYDWMTKPDWPGTSGEFDEAHYLEDLEEFPRTPENVPDWYPTPEIVTPVEVAAAEDDEREPPPPPQRGASPNVPLTGLSWPGGLAVDLSGTVYVTDIFDHRVVALAAGAADPVVLGFTGLYQPWGLAVDAAGTVYVAYTGNHRVLMLAAGASSAVELPLSGLNHPSGLAVDTVGNIYVADKGVLKFAPGAQTATVLPFTGIRYPLDVAVDDAGAVYVIDRDVGTVSIECLEHRVLKLAAGAEHPVELPFSGLRSPYGVTVDAAGTVYVADARGIRRGLDDYGRVLKLAAGATGAVVRSFPELFDVNGVVVDAAGDIYVADTRPPPMTREDHDEFRGRVVKLAADAAAWSAELAV